MKFNTKPIDENIRGKAVTNWRYSRHTSPLSIPCTPLANFQPHQFFLRFVEQHCRVFSQMRQYQEALEQ